VSEREAVDISSFSAVVNKTDNFVCFLLGNSPVSEFYMPTFRNTLSVPSSCWGIYREKGLAPKIPQHSQPQIFSIPTHL